MMQKLVGIFRTSGDLAEATEHIGACASDGQRCARWGRPIAGWNLVFELRNMLICSEAVARSALQRTESRGAHARLDHPGLDADWGKRNNTVSQSGDAMRVEARPLPEMPDDLRSLITT